MSPPQVRRTFCCCRTGYPRLPSEALFRCLFLVLGEGEALGLFPACRAFFNVISALAVSHNSQYSAAYIKHQTSNPPVDGLTYSLPLVSASRLRPSMSHASLAAPFAVANIKNSSVTIASCGAVSSRRRSSFLGRPYTPSNSSAVIFKFRVFWTRARQKEDAILRSECRQTPLPIGRHVDYTLS